MIRFQESRYVRSELLVEPNWLAQHHTDKNLRIVDLRAEKAFLSGHIPGAVTLSGSLRNAEDKLTYLPRPEVFAALMERAGIDNRTHVVIYDDEGGKLAARLWYVLNAFGHKKISLVNGGWQKWTALKLPTTTDATFVPVTKFRVRETPEMTCPLPQFLQRKPGVIVLDVRSAEEFGGKQLSPGAKLAGRVPGAVNVDWKDNVSGPNLEFKSADALRQLYTERGVTPDKEIVVYCASGGRASQTLFTLKLLGYRKVKVYYGSFSDYTNLANVPIDQSK